MTVEIRLSVSCTKCERELGDGDECFCSDCVKGLKDEVESLLRAEKYLADQIEEMKAEQLKKLIITKGDLGGIFKTLCKHQEHLDESLNAEWDWNDCRDCVLRHISWPVTPDIERDLCFAVWHEGILN